jgi:hypothetical protein
MDGDTASSMGLVRDRIGYKVNQATGRGTQGAGWSRIKEGAR